MKCESCNINDIEIAHPSDEGQNYYRVCISCQKRLTNRALRPLEFFNLTSVHGHTYLLHEDFYDDEGNAEQPKVKIVDAEKFPFPELTLIKTNATRLIDFACVQYFISDEVINFLKQHDKQLVLDYLDYKINYNRGINYKVYEIAAKILGPFASDWLRRQWEKRQHNELKFYAIALAFCLPFDEAFEIVTKEIVNSNYKFFLDNSSALLYFQNKKTLLWIEENKKRIKNISISWGVLAAASQFDWNTAVKWLDSQRPLSIIALDALCFCTATGDRAQETFWLRENPVILHNSPKIDIIANRLREYLTIDNVPRTKNTVEAIISNLFETTSK